jgi:2-polyprenyl-6-methoxyphenol hydroxylase-like FAD-dependent oxidoreductase
MRGTATIIGGGIGGLAAAIALRDAGWRTTVLEKEAGLSGAGTALGMWPAALAALDTLGLGDDVRKLGQRQHAAEFRRPNGSRIGTLNAAKLGEIYLLSRPPLLTLLLDSTEVTFGSPVTEVDALDGDVVVAADGIFSRVRMAHFGGSGGGFDSTVSDGVVGSGETPADTGVPGRWVLPGQRADGAGMPGAVGSDADFGSGSGVDSDAAFGSGNWVGSGEAIGFSGEVNPSRGGSSESAVGGAVRDGRAAARFTGSTAWRGWIDDLPTDTFTEVWGRGVKFGVTPQEGGRTNWYATARAPEGARSPGGELAALHDRFGGWTAPVSTVLDRVTEATILRHDLYVVPPLPSFTWGRVALLGDAAHAMPPDLGRGACEALVDAVTLAACLRESSTVEDGLRAYDRARRRPTRRLTQAAAFAARLTQAHRTAPLRDVLLGFALRF